MHIETYCSIWIDDSFMIADKQLRRLQHFVQQPFFILLVSFQAYSKIAHILNRNLSMPLHSWRGWTSIFVILFQLNRNRFVVGMRLVVQRVKSVRRQECTDENS
jgi:hypothetical protein